MSSSRKCVLLFTALVLLIPCTGLPARAAWSVNPSENTPVCTLGSNQYDPQLVNDGAGGVIIVWRDFRPFGSESNIFAQRLDASGNKLWGEDDLVICAAAGNQVSARLVGDGAGGAVIAWVDYRTGPGAIYAQRVDGEGNTLWTTNGQLVCSDASQPLYPELTGDGAGGAVIAWLDFRSGTGFDIYAQRVSSSGSALWAADGAAVCTAGGDQLEPRLASDGAGGAIIAWGEARTGGLYDVYLQRVGASGSMLWAANGLPLGGEAEDEMYPSLISDGTGGVFVAWPDSRSGDYNIHAQRVDGAGSALWAAGGVAVSSVAAYQSAPALAVDEAGGAIVVWQDDRSDVDGDLFAQRLDGEGTALWPTAGVVVCAESGSQFEPRLIGGGDGGAVVAWLDSRKAGEYDIYAQRLDTWGALLWPETGVPVCLATSNQQNMVLAGDGDGGAIIAWNDQRSGAGYDVFAQQVDWNGRRTGGRWSTNPDENNPVCSEPSIQYSPHLASDGMGGVIVAFKDLRSGIYDIYAQHLDANGSPLWPADGVAICTAAGEQYPPIVVSDGEGGAIITWGDDRSGNREIYAQRVNTYGTRLWTTDGVAVCLAAQSSTNLTAESDGAGGVIIAWTDFRSGGGVDVYAQRLDGSGVALWAADGLAVCAAVDDQYTGHLLSDGAGGAIIAWYDRRSGTDYDVYAQRVSGSGSVLWAVDGVSVCAHAEDQYPSGLMSDGMGGAIITWYDGQSGTDYDIYAQRLDASGASLWTDNGLAVCTAEENQSFSQLASDGAGGAIITWEDYRGESTNIYAQRVDATGRTRWTHDGVVVCDSTSNLYKPQILSDDAGGAIIAWENLTIAPDLSAQRIDPYGAKVWSYNGEIIATDINTNVTFEIVSDGRSGVIATWARALFGDNDVLVQRIGRLGFLGDAAPTLRSVIDFPDDQGGVTVLSWEPSCYDEIPIQVITHYSVWMHLPGRGGQSDQIFDSLSDLERAGWVYVDDVPATYQTEYGYHAPTYGDWTGGPGFPLTEYKVIAHTADPWVFWESGVRSGCSVDNLAPGAPLTLIGQPDEVNVLLTWEASVHHDEDLAHYNIYRGNTPGFTADEDSLIGTAADIEYTDFDPGHGTWYYRVAGEDVHGNVGTPSNEAAVPISTSTVAASLTCVPASGTLPFVTGFNVQLTNQYLGQIRRIDGRIHVTLASGTTYTNWRAGFTNVAPGGTYSTSWNQPIPALITLVGDNRFRLVAADVTPAPYNQPPYPPAGDTDSDTEVVTGIAP